MALGELQNLPSCWDDRLFRPVLAIRIDSRLANRRFIYLSGILYLSTTYIYIYTTVNEQLLLNMDRLKLGHT